MDTATLIIAVASAFAVLSAIGVLLTRDNLYAAIYMSVTMLLIAAIYAVYNVQQVVVLIAFVFVGAVGMITIAIAATYRSVPTKKVSIAWIAPVIIVFAITSYFYYNFATSNLKVQGLSLAFEKLSTDYMVLLVFLFSLMILMMLSAIKLARRVEL